MAEPLKCKCGSTHFVEVVVVRGPWRSVFESSAPDDTIHTDLDNLSHGPTPKTVKCEDCGKRHPNPRWKGGSDVR